MSSFPSFPRNVTPNLEAVSIPDLVPGAEMLGYGFNIFGDYSFEAALRPLLTLGPTQPWNAPSGKVYSLPANVNTPGGSSSSADSRSFSSSKEFTSYFQASASVSGSLGAFGGSFGASYSTDQQNNEDYSWALVEADVYSWDVGINYEPDIILPEVLSDADWSGLPQHFDPSDPSNVIAFYQFFQKFGTHFISMVSAGGTLYYYFAVENSAQYSAEQIGVSASAEYHALISSTQVEAQANWGQTAASWTSNRQSHAETVPATPAIVGWVNPLPGSYDTGGSYAEWQDAVTNFPSRANFSLTPIWALFSGSQWSALQAAYAAYGSNRVSVQAAPNRTATMIVNGTPMTPTGDQPTANLPGWQLLVLDSRTLAPQLNRYYTVAPTVDYPDSTYDKMAADLNPYVGSAAYMLIAATSYMDLEANPNAALYAILKSFGGGPALDRWYAMQHGCSDASGTAVYALIGTGAAIPGTEGFSGRDDAGFPMSVNLSALLLPLADGGFTATPYQQ
jgi:MAC/Perforin domain